jgi:signal transduction histidine kinase
MSFRHRSIRARITIAATVIVALVLASLAVLVVLVQQAQLRANLDNTLEQRADQIDEEIVAGDSSDLVNSNAEDRFAQVLDDVGRVLAATDNVDGESALAELPMAELSVSTRSDLPLEDDTYRVLIHRYGDASATRYVIVGENVDDVRDAQNALIVTLTALIPAAVGVLALVVWWLVGRTLRPVDEIRREVDDIGLERLDRRVPVPNSDDEVARLAMTMNDMLVRLEASSARQRQFVADVSHELRTPLTRIRTALEVDLSGGSDDLEATCRSVLDDSIEMQELVDDLLFLARHDAGQASPAARRVDLDVVVDVEVRRQRENEPGVEIDMSDVSAAVVQGSESQLARLVRNLLSNAVRYAASVVTVHLAEGTDSVEFIVSDDGPGIPSFDRDRVFERFVRLDQARTGRDGGAGLGLAIAHDIVVAHRGTIVIGESPSGGACVWVSFPVGQLI